MSKRLRVDVLSTRAEVAALGPAWRELHEASDADHPFASHEWMASWWASFGGDQALRILVVRDGEIPVAILPLQADRTRLYGLAFPRLAFPWNAHTPRLGLVAARGGAEAASALWAHLRGEPSWELLQLCQLPEGSVLSKRLCGRAEADGFLVGRWSSNRSPYVPVQGSFADYVRSLSRKHRASIRNRTNGLEARGPVELESHDGSRDLDALLEEGLLLEASGWRVEAATAVLSRGDTHAFYRRMARAAASRGWLALQFLTVGGRRIAFNFALLYRGTLFCLKGGFHPGFARYSPMNVLTFRILERAFAAGWRCVDLGGQADDFKLRFTPHTLAHHWLYVFRPALRTRLCHLLKFRRPRELPQLLPAIALPGRRHAA